ncbi:MAG: hypothetical protein JW947_01350 [Sedimentisphaerales bacterium]|nr:hypothetical protein [Sedimentisphaerales bacterium]
MSKKKNHTQDAGVNTLADNASGLNMPPFVEKMTAHLKNDRFVEAVKLFLAGQARGIFPKDRNLVKKLVKAVGKNAANRLIFAFAHYPCPFCKKGSSKCRDCNGRGHIDYDMICDRCLGIGMVRCDFCDGSGWMAMRDVPKGLRIVVFIKRAQTVLKRLKLICAHPLPKPSKNNPLAAFKKSSHLLIKIDRYMGVLENVLVMAQNLRAAEPQFKNKIAKITQLCADAAAKAKKFQREIINCMAVAAQLEMDVAKKGTPKHRLAKKRLEFYRNLLGKSDTFVSLSEQHPFLEKAIKKSAAPKNRRKI